MVVSTFALKIIFDCINIYNYTKSCLCDCSLEVDNIKHLTYEFFFSSSFPHLFPLLCGVDVSYDTPPFSSVLRVLPGQFSLRQVVPDTIQPPPLWSSSPSIPRHLHHHHSLAHMFFFSSQYTPISLQPTFLHFLRYFSHLRCPSNSFIPNSVQLGDSTHPS